MQLGVPHWKRHVVPSISRNTCEPWPNLCNTCQILRFAERDLLVTIAARPEFITKRRTNLPEVVLVFCLVLVVVLVGLLVVGVAIQQARSREKEQRRLAEEQHRMKLAEASKQAHERTIAYACHQLRYGSARRSLT